MVLSRTSKWRKKNATNFSTVIEIGDIFKKVIQIRDINQAEIPYVRNGLVRFFNCGIYSDIKWSYGHHKSIAKDD